MILTTTLDGIAETSDSENLTVVLGPNDNTPQSFDSPLRATNVGDGIDPSNTPSSSTVPINDVTISVTVSETAMTPRSLRTAARTSGMPACLPLLPPVT